MNPIDSFLNFIERESIQMDGILLYKDGVEYLNYFRRPYDCSSLHRVYSISKSITALAIGICYDQKILNLDESLGNIFSEELKNMDIDPRVLETTVEQLLKMESPHKQTTYKKNLNASWFNSFFSVKPEKEPGSRFDYDTSSTYVLGVIVEKKSGLTYEKFIEKFIFKPLKFEDAWSILKSPEGYAQSGSGISCSLRDLCKLSQVFLQTNHIVSNEFLEKMTNPTKKSLKQESFSTLHQSYGYQVWLSSNLIIMWGMCSQFLIIDPQNNLVFAAFGNTYHQKDKEKLLFTEVSTLLNNFTDWTPKGNVRTSYSIIESPLKNVKTSVLKSLGIEIEITAINLYSEMKVIIRTDNVYVFPLKLGSLSKHVFSCSDHEVISTGAWIDENRFELQSWFIGNEQGLYHLLIDVNNQEANVNSKLYLEFDHKSLNFSKVMQVL